MVKIIKLSSGRDCLVDDEDYDWLSKTKWSDDSNGYAIRRKYKSKRNTTEKMHRLILGAKPGEIVDHINGNPSDNRRCNLRIVSDKQNARNTKTYSTNKTGYKGVAVVKCSRRYSAQITVNYRKIHLGMFDCPKDAAKAYNEAAIKHFGEFARLNDIDERGAI